MTAIDSRFYVHESDKAALRALKAIPGFHQLMRAYLKIWSERQFRIMNMSSRVRMNDNQLSKYYDMLPPICEKLGIDTPELYLELDVNPNAYTFGDTNPFVVITSGLLETIPDDLVPTVLAHECGHIACHHVLYRTIGNVLLGSTSSAISSFIPYGGIASMPLEVGFYYWMRCSEYSADRAAVICDGTPEKMSEVCMRLAGFEKDVNVVANKEEFLKQALEYKEMVGTSKWDKTLEFLMFRKTDHPLMTVRALECEEWGKSEQFRKILDGTYRLEDIGDEEPEQLDEEEVVKQEKTRKPKGKIALPKFSVPFGKKEGTTSDDTEEQLELSTTFTAPDEIRKYKELMDRDFLKIFKLSSDDLDEDLYKDIMNDIATETWDEESLFDFEYDDFIGTLEAFDVETELEEEDYDAAIEEIRELYIESGSSFADGYQGGSEKTLFYDPIVKAYV